MEVQGTRMIVIYDPAEDAEQPFKCIEEIPAGTDPDEVFLDWMKEYSVDDMAYMFIHPISGSVIPAADEPEGGDATYCALGVFKLALCKLVEVEPEFSISPDEIRRRCLEWKNRWVAYADGRDPMSG